MKDVNVDNLQSIFDRIDSGELQHDQGAYFCGTACCIAGWDFALHHVKEYQEYLLKGATPKESNKMCEAAKMSPWQWSRKYNNLTEIEAMLLFDSVSSRTLQNATLKALKEGRRLDMEVESIGIRQSSTYDNVICCSLESEKELNEFLGEVPGIANRII